MWDKLPIEIIRKIYKEHFECEWICEEFMHCIKSRESQRLNGQPLWRLLPRLFATPLALRLVCSRNETVKNVYEYCKSNNPPKKNFVNLKKGESFALTILFTLYH